jgi:hypothetical protein
LGSDGRIFFRANIGRQRGSGIGGIFGAIARRLLPLAQKYVLPHAKDFFANIVGDIGKRNLKESFKEHSVNALKGIKSQVLNQSGSGVRRKNTSKAIQNKTTQKQKRNLKRKRTPSKDYDIFNKRWRRN